MLFIINSHINFMQKKICSGHIQEHIWMSIFISDAFGRMFQIMQLNAYSDM